MKKKSYWILSIFLLTMLSGCGNEAQETRNNLPEQPLPQQASEDSANAADTAPSFFEQNTAAAIDSENCLTFVTGMKIILPEEWKDKVVMSVEPEGGNPYVGDTLVLSEKNNAEAGIGGCLFYLRYINKKIADVRPYELFPTEKFLGIYQRDGEEYALLLSMPTDMMWVEGDKEMEKAYKDIFSSVDKVQIITADMEGFIQCGKEEVDWIIDSVY